MTTELNLSIIVPVYNAGPYLHKSAQSVFDQSFKDYELIYVNDGSTDDSLAILEELAQQDARVKVYDQKNQGVTAARKLGWLNSSAEYITFLDADDEFSEDGLNILMQEFRKGNYDIVNGSFIGAPSNRLWQHKIIGELNKIDYLKSLMEGRTFGVMYASVYKSQLFKESTFSFDHTIKVGEDVLMNLELCSRTEKIKNLKNVVYRYTDDNAGSAMNVIVRHPSYYIRFNKIRNGLIKDIDSNYYKAIKEKQTREDNNTIIDSYFSPYIDFDLEYYNIVRPLKDKVSRKNGYVYYLSNIGLTKFTKMMISLLFKVKNSMMRRSVITKKILY